MKKQKTVVDIKGNVNLDNHGESEVANITTMDELLEAAGTKGLRNFLIYLAIGWALIIDPLQTMSYQFTGATPHYWCHIQELIDANWTQDQVIQISVPDNQRSSCYMYDLNYTLVAFLGFEKSLVFFEKRRETHKKISCAVRYFNDTEPITTVSKWDLVCNRRGLYSTTQSASQFGKAFGGIVIGYLIDKYGRRNAMLWSYMLYFITGILMAFSPNVYTFIILKILISAVCIAFTIGAFPLALELCIPSQRPFVCSLLGFLWAFGITMIPVIAYFIRPFSYLQLAYTLSVLTLIPNYWLLPESPRWLLFKGRFEEAFQTLERISKYNKRKLPPKLEVIGILKNIHEKSVAEKPKQKVKSNFLYELVKIWTIKGWRRALFILLIGWFSVGLIYYGVTLNPPDLRFGKYTYIFFGGILEFIACIVLFIFTKYMGRKKSFIVCSLFCAVSLFGSMWFTMKREKDNASIDYSSTDYHLQLVLSLSGKFGIAIAFFLIILYTSELIPTEIRANVNGQLNFFARVGSFISPYIVDLIGEISNWAPAVIFGIFAVACGILLGFLPETKKTNLGEFISEKKSKEQKYSEGLTESI